MSALFLILGHPNYDVKVLEEGVESLGSFPCFDESLFDESIFFDESLQEPFVLFEFAEDVSRVF